MTSGDERLDAGGQSTGLACPKGISLDTIGRLNRDYLKAATKR